MIAMTADSRMPRSLAPWASGEAAAGAAIWSGISHLTREGSPARGESGDRTGSRGRGRIGTPVNLDARRHVERLDRQKRAAGGGQQPGARARVDVRERIGCP